MVHRTTFGYFVMAVVAAAMLWGVLHLGSRLRAPFDFSGQWYVHHLDEKTVPVKIEQSGIFVHISVAQGRPKAYVLEQLDQELVLKGADQTFEVHRMGNASGDYLNLVDKSADANSLYLVQDAPR